MEGLQNLRQKGAEIQPVIGEEMWKMFLKANRVPENDQGRWLVVAASQNRQVREKEDKKIFDLLFPETDNETDDDISSLSCCTQPLGPICINSDNMEKFGQNILNAFYITPNLAPGLQCLQRFD
ncbi:hypothetical protein DPMN_044489 [Dreissena polymorpha]|uniref:Uncharacterized protein n=1 Tax=Dreissena polymorpha TaxID=45954 RepID=A0A9D4I0J6_DREPO|nr:hypothetical protein DPMN_044489 [Dreissena polymorpha]